MDGGNGNGGCDGNGSGKSPSVPPPNSCCQPKADIDILKRTFHTMPMAATLPTRHLYMPFQQPSIQALPHLNQIMRCFSSLRSQCLPKLDVKIPVRFPISRRPLMAVFQFSAAALVAAYFAIKKHKPDDESKKVKQLFPAKNLSKP